MKTSKKHICGVVSLGLVAAVTAIAQGIPAQDSAYANSGAGVELQVTVQNEDPVADIMSPSDGAYIVGDQTTIKVIYSNVSSIEYTLEFLGLDGTTNTRTWIVDVSQDGSVASGVRDETVDLSGYGYGTFTLSIRSSANGGEYISEDTVSFRRNSTSIDDDQPVRDDGTIETEVDEKTGNPTIEIKHDDSVKQFGVQVYDRDGNPLFANPLIIDTTDGVDATKITIPFAEYGAKPGIYDVVVRSYDDNGNEIGFVLQFKVRYAPDLDVDVPNTGGITIGDLTISRADYLVSGLVVFGFAAGAGLFILNRKGKTNKTRK